MTKGDDIQERLNQIADKIIALCDTLSPTASAERIGTELLRSTLTPTLKLREARLAETPAESIDNLRQAVVALDTLSVELDWDLYRELTHLTTFVSGRKKTKSKQNRSSSAPGFYCFNKTDGHPARYPCMPIPARRI